MRHLAPARDRRDRFGAVDTFRHHAHAERVRERDDRLHDLLVGLVDGDGADETLVDLDLGGRDLLQVGQGGIAFAEVVDRELDSQLSQPLDARERRGVALHQAILGQLDRELELRHVESRLQCFDSRRELGMQDDLGRHVDRHGEPLGHRGPLRRLRDDTIEDEPGERHDGAVRLGERNEVARRHEVAGVGAPADERLDAADAIRRDLDLRLVVDLELAFRDGALQLGLELPQRGLLLSRIGPIDVERDVLVARFLESELGAAK